MVSGPCLDASAGQYPASREHSRGNILVSAGVQNTVRLEKATEPGAEIPAGAPQAHRARGLCVPLKTPKKDQSKENQPVQVTSRVLVTTRHLNAQVPQAGGPDGSICVGIGFPA